MKKIANVFLVLSLLPVMAAVTLSGGPAIDSQARSFDKITLFLIASPSLVFLVTAIGLNRNKKWGMDLAYGVSAFLSLGAVLLFLIGLVRGGTISGAAVVVLLLPVILFVWVHRVKKTF